MFQDKNPGDRVAAEKFRRVARAYEVLANDDERKKLDYYMENPAEYWQLYGPYVSYAYAPKSSVFTALLLLLLFVSAMQPAIQMSKYAHYVDKLKRAALNKLPLGGGGTPESLEIRRQAEEKLQSQPTKKNSKSGKLDRKKLEEAIDAIIRDLDIEGEFHKPTWREIPIVRAVIIPVYYGRLAYRYLTIEAKRYKGVELDEGEKQALIERYLGGADAWESLSDEAQDELVASECWQRAKFDAWLKARQEKNGSGVEKAKNDSENVPIEASATGKLSAKNKQELRQRRKANQNKRFFIED